MAKLVDASDLKSADASHPGSSPGGRTIHSTGFSREGLFTVAVASVSTISESVASVWKKILRPHVRRETLSAMQPLAQRIPPLVIFVPSGAGVTLRVYLCIFQVRILPIRS